MPSAKTGVRTERYIPTAYRVSHTESENLGFKAPGRLPAVGTRTTRQGASDWNLEIGHLETERLTL